MKNNFQKLIGFLLIVIVGFFSALGVNASTTNGTIDSTNKYAWGENVGWINFGTSEGSVAITDTALTGYAWSENTGWISLNCSNTSSCGTVSYAIANDSEGNLTGYAWSENTGWIQFNPTGGGVTVNSSGNFSGYAWGENVGWIIFNCSTTSSCATVDYKVSTDWRPSSSRSSGSTTPSPSPVQVPPTGGGFLPPVFPTTQTPQPPTPTTTEVIPTTPPPPPPLAERIPNILKPFVPGFLKPKPPPPAGGPPPQQIPVEPLVPKQTPLAFQRRWELLSTKQIKEFVLAPLPKSIRILAEKFPALQQTLSAVGVKKITDVEKLQSTKLSLPNIPELKGTPISRLSVAAKQKLPTEIVFVKTGGELIDVNVALGVNDKGRAEERIRTISGKPLNLSVKPDQKVKSIRGFIVFKKKTPRPTSFEIPLETLGASFLFVRPVFAEPLKTPIEVEEKLVLQQFEYTDPDGDGIYTANIDAPLVEGEYEIITVINYEDPDVGAKEIRLTTVVDPEGYVFEKIGNKETRIPDTVVTLYALDKSTDQYGVWAAKEFQQENPQTTDVTGRYSFLVPEGMYYLRAEAPGYRLYQGTPFEVKEDIGVHTNIELASTFSWLRILDWKSLVLILIILLLFYNFYRDKIRTKNIQ
ncbi:MAG: carboxypeptidase-like regulatory domain-containing protein [Patescibacteria group bacterium]